MAAPPRERNRLTIEFVPRIENIQIVAVGLREHCDASTLNPSPAFSASDPHGSLYRLDFQERLGPYPACFSEDEFEAFRRTVGTEFGRARMMPTQIGQGVLQSSRRNMVPERRQRAVQNNNNGQAGERAMIPDVSQLPGIPVLFAIVSLARGGDEEHAEFRRVFAVVHERWCALTRERFGNGDVTRRGVGWALCIMGNWREATTRSLPPVVFFVFIRRAVARWQVGRRGDVEEGRVRVWDLGFGRAFHSTY
ncbi:hypothetical protein PG984_005348 [Apiospora sp. TS-2023a]